MAEINIHVTNDPSPKDRPTYQLLCGRCRKVTNKPREYRKQIICAECFDRYAGKSKEARRIKEEIHSHVKCLTKYQPHDLMFLAWLIDNFNVGELASIISMGTPRDEVFKDFMDDVYGPEWGRVRMERTERRTDHG
ncbi:MAG: hypothetical protein ACYS5V_17760 [Planctomycetota bacterium]|jgi:hypothetical protein